MEFRYAGPKPQTKEAAIVMLSDGCEGAVRSLQEITPTRIEAVVHNMAMKRLQDGQLDECDMTLRELSLIEASIAKSLAGHYHGRIVYPHRPDMPVPKESKSLALVLDDPDAADYFVHWLVWNIPPNGNIAQHSSPGIEGLNSDDQNTYYGPCPPSGTHRYHFKIYALDTTLDLPPSSTRKPDLEKAILGHILAKGTLIGLYSSKTK